MAETLERWCTAERQRSPQTGKVVKETWHAIKGAIERPDPDDATWDPIACSAEEGICFPGHRELRVPTCMGCLEALVTSH